MSRQVAEQIIAACEAFFDGITDLVERPPTSEFQSAIDKAMAEIAELMDRAIAIRDEPHFWYFTTALDHPRGSGYWKVQATSYGQARGKMVEANGDKWAFQYDSLAQIHELDRKCHGVIT